MSYIGSEPTTAAFLTDQFSGNGSTTTFTLSTAPAGTTSILVSVSGVLQDPSTYGVVGTTLTLGGAAPTGTGNISVRYLGLPVTGIVNTAYRTVTEFTATANQTTFTVPSYTPGFIAVYLNGARLGTLDFTASNGTIVVLATGASADDLVVTESFYVSAILNAIANVPGAVVENNINNGAVNLTTKVTGVLPVANGGLSVYSIDYLIIAGGGAGGFDVGGGGGAGGYLSATSPIISGASYPIVVGAGGVSPVSGVSYGGNGFNSSFGGFAFAIGGGAGGNWDGTGFFKNGLAGGSGGGGGGYTNTSAQGQACAGNQGNAGGPGRAAASAQTGGGGGGAGGIGSPSINDVSGFASGGSGLSWHNGFTYSAGGRGAGDASTGYLPGTTNSGNGGDAQGSGSASTAGGSGIVIIRYASTTQKGFGGVVTSSGGYYYHTFTSSGTYTA